MKKWPLHIFIFCALQMFSQGGQVFNDSILHELSIQIDLPDWFATLTEDYKNNAADPVQYPEIYRNCTVTWDGQTLTNCGIREKGNASNTLTNFGKKKPLKISFDEFTNQNLDGLKKININNFTNDPALMHDVIGFKLMRDAGLAAPRTSYTKLWINNEYIGLCLVTENVDKTFLKQNYGSANNDGNLYKTDRGAAVWLDWLGADPAAYINKGLKLTTNETVNDWSKFISFVDFLNNYNGADFRQQLEARFDIHSFLKALAVEKCVRSWDSYWGGGNNYYLYEHPDGKYRWIPWDMNESFQDIKVLSGTTALNGYLIPTPQIDKRPLLKKIFEFDDYKNEYLDYACDLIHTNFSLEHLGPFIVDRHNLVDEAYRTDPNKINSYGSFTRSLTQDHGDEVSMTKSAYVIRLTYPGIFPFIESQRAWVVDQLKGWEKSCSIKNNGLYNLDVFPNPASGTVNISNEQGAFEYARFKLFDFTGKLCGVTEYDVMSGKFTPLDISNLSPGVYLLLKQSASGKVGRAKVVVQ